MKTRTMMLALIGGVSVTVAAAVAVFMKDEYLFSCGYDIGYADAMEELSERSCADPQKTVFQHVEPLGDTDPSTGTGVDEAAEASGAFDAAKATEAVQADGLGGGPEVPPAQKPIEPSPGSAFGSGRGGGYGGGR